MNSNGIITNRQIRSNNISERASLLLEKDEEFLCKNLAVCQGKPWSREQSDGYINLGTAESSLCENILIEKINRSDLLKLEPSMLRYYKFCGIDSCRKSVAKFVERYFESSIKINPENLVILSGTTSIFDVLSHIIADSGEFFMCTTPYYSRISDDLMERSFVRTIRVPLELKKGINGEYTARINVQWIEDSYNKAISEGKSIKAIVIVNPDNPLGIVHPKDELLSIVQFASEKSLYLIFDEIYGLSVYRDCKEKFYSILSLLDTLPQESNIIWLWGLSKDFCSAGFRTSVFYTQNDNILKAAKPLSFFQCVPSLIQHMTAKLLSDYEWLDKVYFPRNNAALKRNCEIVEKWLHKLEIPYFRPNAGMFVFVNFSEFLQSRTEYSEMKLFEKFMEEKIYVIPGRILYAEKPGWYRIAFAQDSGSVEEGLRRIAAVLISQKLKIHLRTKESIDEILEVKTETDKDERKNA
uniref:Aminotransferase class I/classII domain-containing protein n=1 Tax=Romanomermis culicivorax TaxID=13658 RepID=A0A915JXE1_ROMCU